MSVPRCWRIGDQRGEAEASGEDTFADVPRDTWETGGRSVHPVHDWPSLAGFW